MKSEIEIINVQSDLLNSLVNTDDEREKVYYQGQIRILSWILADEPVKPVEPEVPVSEEKDETGGD